MTNPWTPPRDAVTPNDAHLDPPRAGGRRIIPERIDELRRAARKRMVGIATFFVVLGAILNWTALHGNVWVAVFSLVVIGGAILVGHLLASRRNEEAWRTYELLLADDRVARTQANLPRIELGRADVQKIDRLHDGALVVRGKGAAIAIPPQLEDFETVSSELAAWAAITPRSQLRSLAIMAASLAVGGAASLHFYAREPRTIVLSGLFSAVAFTVFTVVLLRSRNIDRRLKRNAIYLALMALWALYRAWAASSSM